MPIKNMSDLRRELCEVIETVKKDRRYVPQATEITNAAGKIINSLRVELDYYKLAKEALPKKTMMMLENTQ
jgi:hypothetical protein